MMILFPGHRRALTSLIAGVLGGALFSWLATPLPWLLGSLCFTGMVSLLGKGGVLLPLGVRTAQISIGLALGLTFTPVVVAEIGGALGWILGAAVATCLLSLAGAVVFQRITGADTASSFYSSAIGAASDMANQAAAAGARADQVALVHSIRVALVVSLIPWLATALASGPVSMAALAEAARLPWAQTLVLAGVCLVAGALARRVGLPNPWVLGPLLATAAAAQFLPESRLHPVLVAGGQVLLGWNLGQRFQAQLFRESGRLVLGALVMTALYLAAGLVMAAALHNGMGLRWASSLVASAPGGIAEMALTAKVLGLDPALVTAFHSIRLLMMVSAAGLLLRLGLGLRMLR